VIEEISDVGFGRRVQRNEVLLIWSFGSNRSADEMRVTISIWAGTDRESKCACAAGGVSDLKFNTAAIEKEAHCVYADRFL